MIENKFPIDVQVDDGVENPQNNLDDEKLKYPVEKLRMKKVSARIMGLGFAWAHIISEVTSGMENPNAGGSNIRQRNGRDIFLRSPKWRVNSPRNVTL